MDSSLSTLSVNSVSVLSEGRVACASAAACSRSTIFGPAVSYFSWVCEILTSEVLTGDAISCTSEITGAGWNGV